MYDGHRRSIELKENEKKKFYDIPTVQANEIKTSVYITANGQIKKSFSKLGSLYVSITPL